MLSITYEVDPEGDIELVLKKPNNQKIVPILHLTKDLPCLDSKESKEKGLGDKELKDEELYNPPCIGRYSVFKALYPTDETNVSPVDSEVRMRVSSRQLILASRTFQAMLEGPYTKGTSSPRFIRQINVTDWDAMAFAIVLDTIHGRPRGTSEKMNIGLLARIATVVDYYKCRGAVEVHLATWMKESPRLNEPIANMCKTSLLCLYVAWVFSAPLTLSSMTHLALLHSEGLARIDICDLPLGPVLDKIEAKRQSLISESLQMLDHLQEQLVYETGCPETNEAECSALTLGVLMRVRRQQLSSPDMPLKRPYNGYSITTILSMITGIEEPLPLHFRKLKNRTSEWSRTSHPCSIGGRLHKGVERIESEIWSFCKNGIPEKGLSP